MHDDICFGRFLLRHFVLRGGITVPENVVEASSQPVPRLAQREMKKSKDYEASDIYARAHHLIYGNKAPVGPDGRTRIAVIVNGDEGLVVEDRVKNQIYNALREKFPREYFAIMKGNDVNTKLLQRAEDEYYEMRKEATASMTTTVPGSGAGVSQPNGPVGAILEGVGGFLGGHQNTAGKASDVVKARTDKPDVDGMVIGNQPRGLADMRRQDYVEAGKACGYDYVFVTTLSLGNGRDDKHNFVLFNNVTNHQNLWLRVRFVDVNKGDYLYRNDIAVQADSHNGSRTGRVYEHAIYTAMNEAMDDIDVSED